MKFAIITHASHKLKKNTIFSYEPYVREMNLWTQHASEVQIVAPISTTGITDIETNYRHQNIQTIPIAAFDVLIVKNALKTIIVLPKTMYEIYKTMVWADHIHLRCPGNIGLLGCFVQILFPNKPKTAKYAGNWDPNATQPWSYRLQKWLLRNTFLTKNMKVLVYGEWPNQTKNIVPFFTASYSENEMVEDSSHHETDQNQQIATSHTNSESALAADCEIRNAPRNDSGTISFIYVGALTKGKQPLLSVSVVHQLKEKGYDVQLNMYGEGAEHSKIAAYIEKYHLQEQVILHGNCDSEVIKRAYKIAHFLLFISVSEGWPKAVAEAMFWGCLPITGKVSCIPYMLANGERGALVNANIDEIVVVVEDYLQHPKKYENQTKKAMEWSRQFTMEKFEEGIGKVLD